MNCYYHPSTSAVGICKNCYKGLCENCAVDVGNGLACKGHCESDVEVLNRVLDRSKTQMLRLGSMYRRTAWLIGFLGIIFVIVGILISLVLPKIWFIGLLSFALGVYALVAAMINRTESKKQESANDVRQ